MRKEISIVDNKELLDPIDFASREEVKEWIHLNNEARRNLTVHETVRITLERRKEPIAEQAKERQIRKSADFVPQNSAEQKGKETREIIAEIAGVSRDTVDKVEKIEKAAPIPVRDASRKGEISINSAYQVTKMEPEEQNEVAVVGTIIGRMIVYLIER